MIPGSCAAAAVEEGFASFKVLSVHMVILVVREEGGPLSLSVGSTGSFSSQQRAGRQVRNVTGNSGR